MITRARMVVVKHNGVRHPATTLHAEVHDDEPVLVCCTGKNLLIIPMHTVRKVECIILKDDGN
jgi:hypothetical protein